MLIRFFTFGILFVLLSSTSFAYQVQDISLYKSQVLLRSENSSEIKPGDKFLVHSYLAHKCLLIVTRVLGNTIYAQANQCPGFAGLKKGQSAEKASDQEVNEEVRILSEDT